LSGARIVIDPGHGKGALTSGVWDPGAVGHVTEQVINQSVSIILEQKLTAMGAIVYRMPTESQQIMTINRADVARSFNPDLMISIHCNSAGASATGTEAFYFQPFSQPLARYISNNVAVALGTNNRGSQYNEFQVNLQQEFPSSLVELGFVSNYGEAMKLANPAYQDSMANQIVAAIQQYLANN
jgi:N-acetylmuramoyl-L-alanine amidase